MGPIQPILYFSCFRRYFREFRVMIFHLKNPIHETKVHQEIHTVIPGSLEGFAPGFANQRFALRLASLACSQVSFENLVANC